MSYNFNLPSNDLPLSSQNQQQHHHTNHVKINKVSKLLNHDQLFINKNSNLNFNYNNTSNMVPSSMPTTPNKPHLQNLIPPRNSFNIHNYEYQVPKTPVFVHTNNFDNRNEMETNSKNQRRISGNGLDYFELNPRFINNLNMRGGGVRSPRQMIQPNSKRLSKKLSSLDRRQSVRISDSDDSDDNKSIIFSSEINYANKPFKQISSKCPPNFVSSGPVIRQIRYSRGYSNKKDSNNYENHSRYRSPSSHVNSSSFTNKQNVVEINFTKQNRNNLRRTSQELSSSRDSKLDVTDDLTPSSAAISSLKTSSNAYLPYSSTSSSDSVDAGDQFFNSQPKTSQKMCQGRVLMNRSLYYDSGISVDRNACSNSFYVKDLRLNNIRLGEVENVNSKLYEPFGKFAERKSLKSTQSKTTNPLLNVSNKQSPSTTPKINYKTINPAMMRKIYNKDVSELNVRTGIAAVRYEEMFGFVQGKGKSEKSYSEAEFQEVSGLDQAKRNSFISMMSIPVQLRYADKSGKEVESSSKSLLGMKINNFPSTHFNEKGYFDKADFTPNPKNKRSSMTKEESTVSNHSLCKNTTPTNSNNLLDLQSKSLITIGKEQASIKKNIKDPTNIISKSLNCKDFIGDAIEAVSNELNSTVNLHNGVLIRNENNPSKTLNFIGQKKSDNFENKLSNENDTADKSVKKLIAISDYISLYNTNMSLKKGEKYTLISQENEHWYLIKDQSGYTGYAPSNHLEIVTNYDYIETIENNSSSPAYFEKEWFHDNLTRSQAYSLLVDNHSENGTFLVRNNSSDKGKFTLCVYKNGKVYNYKINLEDGKLFLSQKHKFNDLIELVEFYKKNSAGLISNLKYALDKSAGQNNGNNVISSSNTKSTSILMSSPIYKKFTIDRREIEFFEKIGSGQFGVVLKAQYKKRKMVAVKKMKPGSKDDEMNFKREAEFMMKLQSLQEEPQRNLVQFVGISKDLDESILIVTEYVKYGSLYNHLLKNKERIINSKGRFLRLLNICIDVCEGMEYLEANNIIHRDLATRNCLVGDGEVIKVADYGLARFTEASYIAHPQSQFPVKWSAPEVIKHRSYSSKSDVWSFSCLMYEVFTLGKMPYGGSTINSVAAKQIITGTVPEKPFYCPTSLYESVFKVAWSKDPKDRPTFKELMKQLEGFIN